MKHKRRRTSLQEDSADSWLMSYADMITLLMSFFVIFVATSEPRQERLKTATDGMKEQFGTLKLTTPFDGVYREVQGIVAREGADAIIAAEATPRGMNIELAAGSFFTPGSADIPTQQLTVLREVAQRIVSAEEKNTKIEVEGYTSNQPSGGLYETNWELAAVRAARVVRVLAEAGVEPARLSAVSHGEYAPAVPNADGTGAPITQNQARNERVVIRVEKK